jgi:tetratricopeptide (TPR) repeat protein
MLLDRKKINRLTRWSAIILAVIFLLSFVLLGVGSSSAGNVFSGCNGNGSISSSSSFEDREKYYLNQLSDNPQDGSAMLALVSLYSDETIGRYDDAITYLNPNDIDAQLRIAAIYINNLADYETAISELNQVTAAAPTNADAFYLLGLAQRQAGQNQAAIMAWNHYLELAPNSANADLIREEITKLSAEPAVTQTTGTIPGSGVIQVPEAPTQ